MTLELLKKSQPEKIIQLPKCNQKFSNNDRIQVRRLAWVLRVVGVGAICCVIIYNLLKGFDLNDSLIVYSTLMTIHALIILFIKIYMNSSPKYYPYGGKN